jgi:hypothetical protein
LFSKAKESADSALPGRPPFAEVTVYGRDSTVSVTLPPPWNEVKGMAIDGGMVFRLPAKTRGEVDAIRRLLDAEPTLREKRGKPLTFDIVAFYDLVSDDMADVRKAIGMFAADRFLVRIEGESNGVLRVSTISPAGLRGRLKTMFHVQDDGENRLVLKPIRTEKPAATGAVPPAGPRPLPPEPAVTNVVTHVVTNIVTEVATNLPPVRLEAVAGKKNDY